MATFLRGPFSRTQTVLGPLDSTTTMQGTSSLGDAHGLSSVSEQLSSHQV